MRWRLCLNRLSACQEGVLSISALCGLVIPALAFWVCPYLIITLTVSSGPKHFFETMKKFSVLVLLVAALCLTGCAVSSSISNNLTQTQVVLSENNFKVVGQAYGEAQATYIFGIGGLSKKVLRNNAIDEMSKNAKLTGAQTLTNVTTNYSIKMITPVYIQLTCSATANIIEFNK